MSKSAAGPCVRCPKRDRCRTPCEELAMLLADETHHLQGREILVGPPTMNLMLTTRRTTTLADMARQTIERTDLEAVPGLTDRQRRILALAVVDHRTQREIARDLGLSQSTVQEHMTAARRKVRRYLDAKIDARPNLATRGHLDEAARYR